MHTSPTDTYPHNASEEELVRLGGLLGVLRDSAETIDTFRAKVVAAFHDDATIDRAVPTPPVLAPPTPPTGTPMVLGGMTLGATEPLKR